MYCYIFLLLTLVAAKSCSKHNTSSNCVVNNNYCGWCDNPPHCIRWNPCVNQTGLCHGIIWVDPTENCFGYMNFRQNKVNLLAVSVSILAIVFVTLIVAIMLVQYCYDERYMYERVSSEALA
jgi:hypothetical protein